MMVERLILSEIEPRSLWRLEIEPWSFWRLEMEPLKFGTREIEACSFWELEIKPCGGSGNLNVNVGGPASLKSSP